MTDSFPLTAAALRKDASDFHVYEQHLAQELGGLSALQINELNFARLTIRRSTLTGRKKWIGQK
jgi:hypothetical protein